MSCSNAAKTRNLLKFAGVPQTTGSISTASEPKFTILWGHVEDILEGNFEIRPEVVALHVIAIFVALEQQRILVKTRSESV